MRWRGEGPDGPIPLRQGREFGPPQTGPRDSNRPPPEIRHAAFLNTLVMRGKFNIPIYWIIVSIVHAVAYHRKSEERERRAAELEATLAETRVHALRMQLHPHFLFNTLNAISTLVHRDPGAADEMIANLSELLRTTLDTTEQEISLKRELQLLDRYLEIQQVRFGDRLRIERQIEPASLDAKVPTFVLQPLAENALRHGIEPQVGLGVIRIEASRNGNSLRLVVQDNGPGISSTPKHRPGVGLANTKARLQALYGAGARLLLSGAPEGGCTVEVELPWTEASADATRSNENQNSPD
jgi:two-component system, LytTR family, sensor kinase